MSGSFQIRAYSLVAMCVVAVFAASCLEIEPVSRIYKFCKKQKFSKPECECFEKEMSVLSEADHQIIVQYRDQLDKNRKENIVSGSSGEIFHQIGITDLEHMRYLTEMKKDIARKTRKNCKIRAYDYFTIWN